MKKYLVTIVVILAVYSCDNLPKDGTKEVRLENDADMVKYGQTLFSRHCQQCHGNAGVSMMASIPDLTKTALKTEDEISSIVFHGKGNMPAFEEKIGEPEIRAVSLYILSLSKK